MTFDLSIQCECGALRGVATGLTPRTVTRVVCHCRDCQAFAHYLGQAERVLDAHGGTEICQVSPRTVRFESGNDQLACVRLTEKGPYRWFTKCCRSAVANTAPGVPVVGLVWPAVEPGDADFGEVRGRIFGRDAVGDSKTLQASDGLPLPLLLGVIRKLLLRRIRGDHRHSPFEDEAEPIMLGDTDREALESQRLAWRPRSA